MIIFPDWFQEGLYLALNGQSLFLTLKNRGPRVQFRKTHDAEIFTVWVYRSLQISAVALAFEHRHETKVVQNVPRMMLDTYDERVYTALSIYSR